MKNMYKNAIESEVIIWSLRVQFLICPVFSIDKTFMRLKIIFFFLKPPLEYNFYIFEFLPFKRVR